MFYQNKQFFVLFLALTCLSKFDCFELLKTADVNENPLTELLRAKRSSQTTICVQIKPSSPSDEPFILCKGAGIVPTAAAAASQYNPNFNSQQNFAYQQKPAKSFEQNPLQPQQQSPLYSSQQNVQPATFQQPTQDFQPIPQNAQQATQSLQQVPQNAQNAPAIQQFTTIPQHSQQFQQNSQQFPQIQQQVPAIQQQFSANAQQFPFNAQISHIPQQHLYNAQQVPQNPQQAQQNIQQIQQFPNNPSQIPVQPQPFLVPQPTQQQQFFPANAPTPAQTQPVEFAGYEYATPALPEQQQQQQSPPFTTQHSTNFETQKTVQTANQQTPSLTHLYQPSRIANYRPTATARPSSINSFARPAFAAANAAAQSKSTPASAPISVAHATGTSENAPKHSTTNAATTYDDAKATAATVTEHGDKLLGAPNNPIIGQSRYRAGIDEDVLGEPDWDFSPEEFNSLRNGIMVKPNPTEFPQLARQLSQQPIARHYASQQLSQAQQQPCLSRDYPFLGANYALSQQKPLPVAPDYAATIVPTSYQPCKLTSLPPVYPSLPYMTSAADQDMSNTHATETANQNACPIKAATASPFDFAPVFIAIPCYNQQLCQQNAATAMQQTSYPNYNVGSVAPNFFQTPANVFAPQQTQLYQQQQPTTQQQTQPDGYVSFRSPFLPRFLNPFHPLPMLPNPFSPFGGGLLGSAPPATYRYLNRPESTTIATTSIATTDLPSTSTSTTEYMPTTTVSKQKPMAVADEIVGAPQSKSSEESSDHEEPLEVEEDELFPSQSSKMEQTTISTKKDKIIPTARQKTSIVNGEPAIESSESESKQNFTSLLATAKSFSVMANDKNSTTASNTKDRMRKRQFKPATVYTNNGRKRYLQQLQRNAKQ